MLFTFGLQRCLMLVRQLDKNVFQAGRERTNFGHGNTFVFQATAQSIERKIVVNESVNRLAKNCRAANAGDLTGRAQSAGDFRRGDFDAYGTLGINIGQFAERIGRAVGDELAVIDVGNVAAAFLFGAGSDVETFHVSGSAAQRKQAGQHFDYGGFAASVWAEKAKDFAFLDAEADVIDSDKCSKLA